MRHWRTEKRLHSERRESGTDETRAKLQRYAERNLAILRRREVQRMLDLGKGEVEIIVAFGQREELLPFLASCRADPERALKRDLADIANESRKKSEVELIIERQIRQTRDQLADNDLSARDRTLLFQHLHRLERESKSSPTD